MIGLHHQDELNEKFKQIVFGMVLEENSNSLRWVIRPIIDRFEIMLYADLMKYINDQYDVLFCKRCGDIIEDPQVGQLRNYRTGIGAYPTQCWKKHKQEKNTKLKQDLRKLKHV